MPTALSLWFAFASSDSISRPKFSWLSFISCFENKRADFYSFRLCPMLNGTMKPEDSAQNLGGFGAITAPSFS
jgi:hypothetical protein